MRWRPRPRLAFAIGLLFATTLTAASGLLRSDTDASNPTLAVSGATVARLRGSTSFTPSIDLTLSRDLSGCAGARSTVWNPLAGVEYTGRLRIDLPARYGGAIVLFIGDTLPLEIDAETPTGDPVRMQRERFRPGPGLHIPPDFWLDDQNPWSAPGHVIRATIDAFPERNATVIVSLGRRAPRVLVRLIGYPDNVRVPVCAVPTDNDSTVFATGWYGEGSVGGPSERWMRDVGAVLVGSASDGAVTVRARAAPAVTSGEDPTRLTLLVNDVLEMPAQPMREGLADYEWRVPDSAWISGTNELLFSVSRTTTVGTRTFGMSLRALTLLRRE